MILPSTKYTFKILPKTWRFCKSVEILRKSGHTGCGALNKFSRVTSSVAEIE